MKTASKIAAMAACVLLAGCDQQTADRPPRVVIGDSVCDACNMIISDARWATATMVQGARGPEPLLFDDFNCQVNYEAKHPDLQILARWSRDQVSRAWFPTEQGSFVMSPKLRTPMGSMTAAYQSKAAAEAAGSELACEIMTFDATWHRLAGGAKTCCAVTGGGSDTAQECGEAP